MINLESLRKVGVKVGVVEDNPAVVEITNLLLLASGYEVVFEADNYKTAVDKIQTFPNDSLRAIFIVDRYLGEQDAGRELIETIRRFHQDALVIDTSSAGKIPGSDYHVDKCDIPSVDYIIRQQAK